MFTVIFQFIRASKLNKNISKIEAVQRRAARFCLGKVHTTFTIIHANKTKIANTRRKCSCLTMFYKIVNGRPREHLQPKLDTTN